MLLAKMAPFFEALMPETLGIHNQAAHVLGLGKSYEEHTTTFDLDGADWSDTLKHGLYVDGGKSLPSTESLVIRAVRYIAYYV